MALAPAMALVEGFENAAAKGYNTLLPVSPHPVAAVYTVLSVAKNSLLRCFQFLSPETIPYGRFCWNQDCQYCRVMAKLPDDDKPREMLSCKFMVMPGMEITEISPELKLCLRPVLQKQTRTAAQPASSHTP